MVALCERTHLGVISIIMSCDRLLERDLCAPYGAQATRAIDSLAGQPLLTQKARNGLVNEGTSACPQVDHMTYQSNFRV